MSINLFSYITRLFSLRHVLSLKRSLTLLMRQKRKTNSYLSIAYTNMMRSANFFRLNVNSITYSFILLCIMAPTGAIADNQTDHPLVSRFKGAINFNKEVFDYIDLEIPVGRIDDANSTKNIKKIEGKGTFISYMLARETAQFEFIKTLNQQIKASGFKVLFKCETAIDIKKSPCGNDLLNLTGTSRVFRGVSSGCGSYSDSFFISAVLEQKNRKNTYLYLCSNKRTVAQSIIEEKEFDSGKLTINTKDYRPTTESLSGLSRQTHKDIANARDHALISRYKGAYITEYDVADFIRTSLPINPVNQYKTRPEKDFISANGKGTFISYRTQKGVSQYQVLKNYESALKKAGIDILFQCTGSKECGENMREFSTLGKYIDGDRIRHDCGSNSSSYITARIKTAENRNTYLFYCINAEPSMQITQAIIEEKSIQTNLVLVSADEMKKSVREKGKIAIYGIHFNTDSAKIKPESEASLKEIARFLSENPEIKLYIVGHTDNQGKEKYNMSLSQKRGESVIQALTKKFGISKNRLQARGVGPLVPVSSNRENTGKELNRRVELVEM